MYLQIANKRYSNIKMLVFDMAGTTINENGIVYETLFETIKSFGLNVSRNDIPKWHGLNKYEVLNNHLETNSIIEQKKIADIFNNSLKEKYFFDNKVKLISPILPLFFNRIRENDIKIGLNTGYPHEIQSAIINKLGMYEFIDDSVSSDQVPFGRPYPYMIQKLMNNNNITNKNTVIKIGDTKNDILEGLNADCRASIGVLSGAESKIMLESAGADAIINTVVDIKLY